MCYNEMLSTDALAAVTFVLLCISPSYHVLLHHLELGIMSHICFNMWCIFVPLYISTAITFQALN